MSLHASAVRMRMAKRLHIPQHAIDQYLNRSQLRPSPPGHEVVEIINAEFVMGQHRRIIDQGFPRLAVLWASEPLITLVKPESAEGRPLVLTVLTSGMYLESLRIGRFVAADDGLVDVDLKAFMDLRAQLGEANSWLRKICAAMAADSPSHAVQRAVKLRRSEAA